MTQLDYGCLDIVQNTSAFWQFKGNDSVFNDLSLPII